MITLLQGNEEADNIYIFVKQEPHSAKKILEGRWRLISAISLVDTMIDRIIFGNLADEVIQSVGLTPIMIAYTPVHGGYKFIVEKLDRKVISADKSMWDWTVPLWLLQACKQVILNLNNDSNDMWTELVNIRFDLLFNKPIFEFGDGTKAQQQIPGVMKSGCFLTIILNSMSQLLLHYLISEQIQIDHIWSEPLCAGDDTAQNYFDEWREYFGLFHEYGFKIKEIKITNNFVEFAGFILTKHQFWPAYWKKHLYNLQHSDPQITPEMLKSYMLLYQYDDYMNNFVREHMRLICPKEIIPDSIVRMFLQSEMDLNFSINYV